MGHGNSRSGEVLGWVPSELDTGHLWDKGDWGQHRQWEQEETPQLLVSVESFGWKVLQGSWRVHVSGRWKIMFPYNQPDSSQGPVVLDKAKGSS